MVYYYKHVTLQLVMFSWESGFLPEIQLNEHIQTSAYHQDSALYKLHSDFNALHMLIATLCMHSPPTTLLHSFVRSRDVTSNVQGKIIKRAGSVSTESVHGYVHQGRGVSSMASIMLIWVGKHYSTSHVSIAYTMPTINNSLITKDFKNDEDRCCNGVCLCHSCYAIRRMEK